MAPLDFVLSKDRISHVEAVETEGSLDWRSVTRSMANGDSKSLAVFYESQFEVMLAEARRCSGLDESSCLDLVQESMIKAIRCIKPMDNEKAVSAWSRAVVKSVTWDWFRSQKRMISIDRSAAPEQPDPRNLDQKPKTASEGFLEVEKEARLIWLEDELQSLPHELQTMISLRYRLGWSLKKIGQRFGIRTGAVDGRIRRAIDRLRKKAMVEFIEDSIE